MFERFVCVNGGCWGLVGGRKRAKTQSELSTGVRVIRLALFDSAPTIETGGKMDDLRSTSGWLHCGDKDVGGAGTRLGHSGDVCTRGCESVLPIEPRANDRYGGKMTSGCCDGPTSGLLYCDDVGGSAQGSRVTCAHEAASQSVTVLAIDRARKRSTSLDNHSHASGGAVRQRWATRWARQRSPRNLSSWAADCARCSATVNIFCKASCAKICGASCAKICGASLQYVHHSICASLNMCRNSYIL